MKPLRIQISAFFFAGIFLLACQQQESKNESVTAVSTSTEAPKPRPITTIQWIDSAKNLGKVKEGEKIEINYRFKNTGNEQLIINNVVVSCGCTVAEKPQEPIAPGAEGIIKATFDTKGRVGTNHKTMTVYANTAETVNTVSFDVEVLSQK
jgi:hypothetical protein